MAAPLDGRTEQKTDYGVAAESFAVCVSYPMDGVFKVALYWRMSAKGAPGEIDANEIAEARWVTLVGAKRMLSHAVEYRLMHKAWGRQGGSA